MRTVFPLPLATFSQVDYPIELENMFDYQQNQTFTRLTTTTGTLTYSGTAGLVIGNEILVTFVQVGATTLNLIEIPAEVTSTPAAGVFNIVATGLFNFPAGVSKVSYQRDGDSPFDVTFGLQPTDKPRDFFKIRANSEGKGKVFIGEILRTYLPEILAPKDYGTDIEQNRANIKIVFNGQEDNEINVYYGSKYLDIGLYTAGTLSQSNNPLKQVIKMFKEQMIGYLFYPSAPILRINTADYEVGLNTYTEGPPFESQFNLYPAIPCRKSIYLSANYGLLPDGELIDVSVPVLAFINRAGQYEYIRFTGSNVNKYNVQEARLKQDYAGTLTNADTGLIYEGIDLTLADDGDNTVFPYRIDKLELQRCRALLMESPKAWLLVNGDLQQCLEVRVKRESVVFATSLDTQFNNYTAQCEVIVCQTLGNPQY